MTSPYAFPGLPEQKRWEIQKDYARPFIQKVIAAVSKATGVSEWHIKSKVRKAEVAAARQIVMHIARSNRKITFTAIGNILRRDHSTVMYSVQEAENRLETDKNFKRLYEKSMRIFNKTL